MINKRIKQQVRYISLSWHCKNISDFIPIVIIETTREYFGCTNISISDFSCLKKCTIEGKYLHFYNDPNIVSFKRVMRGNLERPKFQRKISHSVLSVRQLEKKDTPPDKRIPGKGKPRLMKSLVPRSKGDERTSKYQK